MGFWQFATGGGSGGGSGDVVGPASATDFGIAYFDDTTGKLLASSAATITAAGSLTIPSAETIEFSTDTGLARSAAGVVKVTDGSTGLGSILLKGNATAASIKFNGSTATDPALGTHASVTTANVHAFKGDLSDWTGVTVSRLDFINRGVALDSASTSYGARINVNADGGLTVTDSAASNMRWVNAIVLVEANTAGSGTPNAIGAVESGTVFTNEGVTAKNYEALPTAAAGYQYTFIVQDADGMRIVANTGDTIRVIDKVTAAAGYIESTTIGSVVTLIAINATEWIATSIHGTWTDGTFTYDDTSLTTP